MQMRRYVWVFLAAMLVAGLLFAQAQPGVTIFEGARLIVGDGTLAIENSAFIVNGTRFTQVGRGRAGAGSCGRAARGPARQDGHARDHRHAHAPGNESRDARSTSCSARPITASASR